MIDLISETRFYFLTFFENTGFDKSLEYYVGVRRVFKGKKSLG